MNYASSNQGTIKYADARDVNQLSEIILHNISSNEKHAPNKDPTLTDHYVDYSPGHELKVPHAIAALFTQ